MPTILKYILHGLSEGRQQDEAPITHSLLMHTDFFFHSSPFLITFYLPSLPYASWDHLPDKFSDPQCLSELCFNGHN